MKKHLERERNYWKDSSKRNWQMALDLYKLKHYDGCLFFCHLALEKMLKSLVMKRTQKYAPYIHDLAKLANRAGLPLNKQHIQQLRTITSFNVTGRYENDKLSFYKRCTPKFTKQYIDITKKYLSWFEEESQKK